MIRRRLNETNLPPQWGVELLMAACLQAVLPYDVWLSGGLFPLNLNFQSRPDNIVEVTLAIFTRQCRFIQEYCQGGTVHDDVGLRNFEGYGILVRSAATVDHNNCIVGCSC